MFHTFYITIFVFIAHAISIRIYLFYSFLWYGNDHRYDIVLRIAIRQLPHVNT